MAATVGRNLNNQMQTETSNGQEQSALAAATLLADGWREYPNQFRRYARCFYKRFDTPTRCHGNDDKPGVQIQIAVSVMEEWMSS